jgi:hypothetical protein
MRSGVPIRNVHSDLYHCHTSVTQIPKWVELADQVLTECVRIRDDAGSPWGPIHSRRDHHHKHPGRPRSRPHLASPAHHPSPSARLCIVPCIEYSLSLYTGHFYFQHSHNPCVSRTRLLISLAHCPFPSLALLGLLLSPPLLLLQCQHNVDIGCQQ